MNNQIILSQSEMELVAGLLTVEEHKEHISRTGLSLLTRINELLGVK